MTTGRINQVTIIGQGSAETNPKPKQHNRHPDTNIQTPTAVAFFLIITPNCVWCVTTNASPTATNPQYETGELERHTGSSVQSNPISNPRLREPNTKSNRFSTYCLPVLHQVWAWPSITLNPKPVPDLLCSLDDHSQFDQYQIPCLTRESNTNQNRNLASREGKSPMAIPMCKSYSATDQSELQCVTQTRSSPSPPYLERVLIYNPTHGVFIQIYPSLPATKPLFPESYQRSHNQAGFSHMKIESGPISSGPRIN